MLVTLLGFLLCAAVIFFSGTKLAHYGDQMAELTGMGKAWFGLIMMASVTSLSELYQGISTNKINSEASRLLRKLFKHHTARYYLKKETMELESSGFPFERFVAESFRHQFYGMEVGIIMQRKCVSHEIDLLAQKKIISW